MLRRMLAPAVLIALVASGLAAQEAQIGTRVYSALFQVGFGDLPQWLADQRLGNHLLDDLVAAGSLTAHNIRIHHTGGEYNIRQALVGTEDTDFEEAWESYLGGMARLHPTEFERSNRNIQAHTDEIWNITVTNLPAGAAAPYIYDAQFQINFADLGRWSEQLEAALYPALDQAMSDGLLAGYLVEEHNTGGRFNWKILYFFEEWDDIDDFEAAVFAAVPLGHPIWAIPRAHQDDLWQAPPEM